jgi:DNA-binding CsgD family transcriptional regulator
MAFAKSLSTEAGRAYGELSGAAADSLGLTERERSMVEMIARGLANKEIASELGISPATVRTHIYNLYRKVGARSRVELLNRIAGR